MKIISYPSNHLPITLNKVPVLSSDSLSLSFSIENNDHSKDGHLVNSVMEVEISLSTSDVKTETRYTYVSKKKRISPIEWGKSVMNSSQKNLALTFRLSCENEFCMNNYSLISKPLTIDFNKGLNQKGGKLRPIELLLEEYRVFDNKKMILISSAFEENKTAICMDFSWKEFLYPPKPSFYFETSTFIKFPLDEEVLIKKIKAGLLFS